jgi:Zn-finger nucleic acid-binding protein
MKCPACKDATLAITERQGIEIDYCPDCRGVWLDRGELDKLIERADRAAGGRPHGGDPGRHARHEPRYRDDDNDGRRYKPRKSFLRELFD